LFKQYYQLFTRNTSQSGDCTSSGLTYPDGKTIMLG
jgi:hypothetical protein